jgi:hypothetical protein
MTNPAIARIRGFRPKEQSPDFGEAANSERPLFYAERLTIAFQMRRFVAWP